MFSDEHLYSIALRKSALVGDAIFKRLIDAEGSAEKVWKLPKRKITKTYGIGERISADIGNENHLKFAEKEIEFCLKIKSKSISATGKICQNFFRSATMRQPFSIRKAYLMKKFSQ
ncbi:hypothetical protein [Chryseobacterium taklimakanense]|uniref:hypothetical protein n=1 Tax=Chryseobacterium taklimakanense TaxID=536441 RepID=UPI002938F74D|nr:hypothetical protein [Chryseobacterium taklimakanense]